MAISKTALNTELQTDPDTLGYASYVASNNDQALANLLNDISIGISKGYSLTKKTITAAELQSCVIISEWQSRTDEQKSAWTNLLIASAYTGVPTTNANIISQAQSIWNNTTTLNNLANAIVRSCSRAETLGGEGTIVSAADVSNALRN
jgi:hypothetical protein